MMTRFLTLFVAVALMETFAAPASAQGVATSFSELRLLVSAGDTVTIRHHGGEESKGKILSLSPTSIAILTGGERRDLDESDVSTIVQRRQDSLKDGALWGAGVAAVTFGIGLAQVCEGECGSALLVTGILFYGGLGAGIGVGVDALITSPRVIFERGSSSSRLRVSPFLGHHRGGVALSMAF
jgi:hypothetical protein